MSYKREKNETIGNFHYSEYDTANRNGHIADPFFFPFTTKVLFLNRNCFVRGNGMFTKTKPAMIILYAIRIGMVVT